MGDKMKAINYNFIKRREGIKTLYKNAIIQ